MGARVSVSGERSVQGFPADHDLISEFFNLFMFFDCEWSPAGLIDVLWSFREQGVYGRADVLQCGNFLGRQFFCHVV